MLCRCSVATLLGSWPLARLLESWPLARLLESWSLSLVCRWFIAVTGLSLVHHCSVTGLSLVHRCSVTGLSLVHRCSACSSFCWSVTAVTDLSARAMVTDPSVVCRSFAPRPSDRPSLLVCPLLRLLVHHWPVACLSAGPSLVCLLARRCSSVAFLSACLSAGPSLLVRCWHIVGLPACPSLAVTVLYLFVVAGLSPRPSPPVSSSVSSSIARRWSVAGLSLVHYWSVSSSIARHWSVCSGQGRCPVVGLLLVCHLPVVGHGRSCVCSFVARCSPVAPPACPSLACQLVRCFPVCCSFTSLSARAMVAGSSLVHLLPVAAPSTGVVTGPSLVCPLVRHSSI